MDLIIRQICRWKAFNSIKLCTFKRNFWLVICNKPNQILKYLSPQKLSRACDFGLKQGLTVTCYFKHTTSDNIY